MSGALQPSESALRLDGPRAALVSAAVGAAGWLATLVLVAGSAHGTERFFRSYLVSFAFFLSLGLGALFFVLIGHLTRAGWNVVLRRLAEAVAWTLPPFSLLAILLFLGRHALYEWAHPQTVAADELLLHKQPYLNENFFLVRLLAYFAAWSAIVLYFGWKSAEQDRSGDPAATLQMERMSGPAMIVYAMTVTFAAFDLLMSLYPHWYSTIYGLYWFAGGVLGCFALITLLTRGLQRAGKLRQVVTTEHYHDLGRLLFAFITFWAYVAFSQYMLIWYAHVPEETAWYLVRQSGPWRGLSLLLLFGHFVAPFLFLIQRAVKRSPALLSLAAAWMLAMHWLDLYWLVLPESSPQRLPFHLLDVTTFAGVGGLFCAVVFWRLQLAALIPLRDPRLEESLGLENV